MTPILTSDPTPPVLLDPWLEHAPSPMATIYGAEQRVRDINAAFCRLVGLARDNLIGRAFRDLFPEDHECAQLLKSVYYTGKPENRKDRGQATPLQVFASYMIWPVVTDGYAAYAVLQITEATPLHDRTLEMNQALLLGSLRQHELTQAAYDANMKLQIEIIQRMQSERDALTLTKEISHRIKNNLQVVVSLIANEIRRTPPELVRGYVAMQARIAAIAKLYDIISQSSSVQTVPVGVYLQEIARTLAASLLEPSSLISIEVRSDAVDIDSERAVPFGLLINELSTNAIKHAFPGGSGEIMISVERIFDQIVLTVADDGIGMGALKLTRAAVKHGSDYVAVFVRQLGGTIAVSGSSGTGTTVTVRFPAAAL